MNSSVIYEPRVKAILLLDDGTVFYGKAIGSSGTAFGEICFNTGMTGYQEIFTDPSYFGQIMVMANVHIGNYGVNYDDMQSSSIKISGLVCRNFSYNYSRIGAKGSLLDFIKEHRLFGIQGVDTRALVGYIRDHGSVNAVISTEVNDIDSLKQQLAAQPSMKGLELASKVSTKEPYYYGKPDADYKIAVLDLGIKRNILVSLAERNAYVKVFPYDATFEEVSQWQPDGYFISNGPGDPEPLVAPRNFVKAVIAKGKPLFGICLGHQIIALANGISTFKMHNGHRGINHSVINLQTGKGEITSQNHGFAIDKTQTEQHPDIILSHVHLNDSTVAGIRMKDKPCFSVQYHPEASPGPNDSKYLFDQFIQHIKNYKKS